MKWSRVVLILTVLLAGLPASAEVAEEREAYEKKIAAQLEEMNAEALGIFLEANQAREARNFKKAAELYAKVRELAPGYVHAVRRQCQAELELGNRAKALKLCRSAVAQDGSWENLASLSMALGTGTGGTQPLVKDLNEALDLALKAARLNPDHLQREMTTQIRASLAMDGIAVSG